MLEKITGKGTNREGKLTNKPARPGDRKNTRESVKQPKRGNAHQREVSTAEDTICQAQQPGCLEVAANADSVWW